MPDVKGRPQPAGDRLGSYGTAGAAVGDSGAVCEQMARMRQEMAATHRSIIELLEMNRQMLESMQHQHQAVARLIERVDRASGNGDEAVQKMADAAEAMKGNTDMIVRAALTTALAMGDQDQFEAAKARADQEMKRWAAEQRGLTLASSSE